MDITQNVTTFGAKAYKNGIIINILSNTKKNKLWNYLLLNRGKSRWWNPSGKVRAKSANNG